MTALFKEIESLIPKCHGWCSVAKAHALASIVLALRPSITLEIGVWGGRSLLPMAMAHKHLGYGEVIGIDPWHAFNSIEGQPEEHKQWWGKIDHESVYLDFCRKIDQHQLSGVVRIHRQPSDAVKPPDLIDLAHIDGNHGPQALRDAQRFAVNIRVGGMLCLDDLTNSTPEWAANVGQAADFCKSIGFRELYRMDTCAFYQRVSWT